MLKLDDLRIEDNIPIERKSQTNYFDLFGFIFGAQMLTTIEL